MAQGLRCPHCGHKHPLAQLPGTPTFRCSGCGQVLKIPAEYRSAGAPSGSTPVGPAPERRRSAPAVPSTYRRPAPRPAPVPRTERDIAAEETAAMAAVAPPPRVRASVGADGARRPRPGAPLAWPWRVLAWVVSVPVGFLIVVFVARWLGLLTGNNLFDVISGSGIGRYVRLFAIAPFAALVIATLAHFALERLPVVLERRRAARGVRGGVGGPAYDDTSTDPRGQARAPQRTGRPAGRRTAP